MTPATDGPARVAAPAHNRLVRVGEPVVVIAPEPQPPPAGWPTSRAVLVMLVLVGFGLRAAALADDRNLWIDEAMLALNLVERSPAQLLEPLGWNQGAPAGFLLAVKGTITALGVSDVTLRLLPFVGSLAGLAGLAWVARRLLPAPAATLAVGLAAVHPLLLSYAAECKQYGTDAAAAVGLFAAAAGLLQRKGGSRRWAVLAACGAAAVWFSHPAAFFLGGVGTALFADAVVARDRRRALASLATVGCWLASFAVCYVTTLKQLGHNQYLLDYWAGHFLPLPPRSVGDVAWVVDHVFEFFAYPGGLSGSALKAGGLAAVLYAVGVVSFARERWPVAVALVLPAALAMAASGLHKYPFAGRLLLFLVPLMLLGVARGAWEVFAALRPARPLAAATVPSPLLAAPLLETYQQVRRPLRYEQLAPLLADLRGRVRPGDKVYLYWGGVPAFLHYTRDDPFPAAVALGTEHKDGRTAYRDELRAFAGERRVWVVFSHRHQAEESLLRAYAEGLGECREELRSPGASAFRYDFGAGD
jgi:hypothetical protein